MPRKAATGGAPATPPPGHTKGLAAGREYRESGTGAQELVHNAGGFREQVLAVVKHEQDPSTPQVFGQAVDARPAC